LELSFKERLFDLVNPHVLANGCELVDVEYTGENRDKVLRIIIDKQEGVSIDDCANVSTSLDPILDEADIIQSSYTLEVTSPGVDRPLKTDADLSRNKGRLVEIKLNRHIEGKNIFQGILDSYSDQEISIIRDDPFIKGVAPKTNGQNLSLSRADIGTIKQAIRF